MRVTKCLATAASLACLPLVSAWSCLSDADVSDIVGRQITFLAHQNATAAINAVDTLFSPNILELSDSINTLRGEKVNLALKGVAAFADLDVIARLSRVHQFIPIPERYPEHSTNRSNQYDRCLPQLQQDSLLLGIYWYWWTNESGSLPRYEHHQRRQSGDGTRTSN